MRWCMMAAAVTLVLLAPGEAAAVGNVTFGVKGGYSLSKLTDIEDASSEGAVVGGGFLSLGLGRSLFVRGEALYLERRIENGLAALVPDTPASRALSQNYLVVPVVIGARVGLGLVQPSIYIGGSADFETSCDIEIEDSGVLTHDCDEDHVNTQDIHWSGAVGASVDVIFNPFVIHGDVRYTVGFSEFSEGSNSKWNTFLVMVGLGIRFGA